MAIERRLAALERANPALPEPEPDPIPVDLHAATLRLALEFREGLADLLGTDPSADPKELPGNLDAADRAVADNALAWFAALEALHAELPACTPDDAALYARLKATIPAMAAPYVYRDGLRLVPGQGGYTLNGRTVCTRAEWERYSELRTDISDGDVRLPGESFWTYAERLEAAWGWDLDDLYGRGGTPWTKPVE